MTAQGLYFLAIYIIYKNIIGNLWTALNATKEIHIKISNLQYQVSDR